MSRPRHGARGVATVEAAITIPLMLALMFAIVELGRAYVQYTTLANSVRDAARHLAGSALTVTQIVFISPALTAETQNLAVFGNEAGAGAPVLPGLGVGQIAVANAGNNNVQVTATYPYQPILGPTLQLFGIAANPVVAFNLNVVVTMRAL